MGSNPSLPIDGNDPSKLGNSNDMHHQMINSADNQMQQIWMQQNQNHNGMNFQSETNIRQPNMF